MRRLLDVEGPVIGFLEKCGQLILLSTLWLLGCIPLFTICASTAALYDSVMGTVRGEEGKTAAAYWESFRRNFPAGCLLWLLLALGFAIPEALSIFLFRRVNPTGLPGVLMVVNLFVCIYAPAVLAKFRRGAGESWKIAFVLSLQYAHYTLALVLGTLVLVLLQIYVFPMALCLILPGAWCWCSSFLTERVLCRYRDGKRNDTGH